MSLYMPPIASKKRETYETKKNVDSKRVFGNYEEDLPTAQSHYDTVNADTLVKHRFSPTKTRVLSPARQHNPHPSQVGFLVQDCRLLHDPICKVKCCAVESEGLNTESSQWWKWATADVKEVTPVTKYSYHSTNHDHYRQPENTIGGETRHGSNPRQVSKGITPITSIPSESGPRLLVEHISYQHQYNSRTNPNQPIRGKQHGSFVWDCFHPVSPPRAATTTIQTTTGTFTTPWASTTADAVKIDCLASTTPPSLREEKVQFREVAQLGSNRSTLPPVAS